MSTTTTRATQTRRRCKHTGEHNKNQLKPRKIQIALANNSYNTNAKHNICTDKRVRTRRERMRACENNKPNTVTAKVVVKCAGTPLSGTLRFTRRCDLCLSLFLVVACASRASPRSPRHSAARRWGWWVAGVRASLRRGRARGCGARCCCYGESVHSSQPSLTAAASALPATRFR